MQQYIIKLIENHWYKKPRWWISLLLLPLSCIFGFISKLRYIGYKINLFKKYRLNVPVVIVGNITVGGVGKTPFTKYLVKELAKHNIKSGVILRGYKGKNNKNATIVDINSNSIEVGDEALIYATNNIPVAIGKNRYMAGIELLKHYPNLQIIISDDGLQHYSLIRDYEIAIIDFSRIKHNLHLLPNGSLRESIKRLKSVNSIVLSGGFEDIPTNPLIYNILNKKPITKQFVELDLIYNPVTKQQVTPNFFQNQKIITIAGMGNPQKFFDYVNTNLKINTIKNKAYPDHYYYKPQDINNNLAKCDAILVTEKDYMKIAQLKLNNDKIWVIMIKPLLDNSQIISDIIKLKNNT